MLKRFILFLISFFIVPVKKDQPEPERAYRVMDYVQPSFVSYKEYPETLEDNHKPMQVNIIENEVSSMEYTLVSMRKEFQVWKDGIRKYQHLRQCLGIDRYYADKTRGASVKKENVLPFQSSG